ncbi:hypothetical protein ACFL0W_04015 [Nanoarchaeota archaeon]
MKLKSPKKRAQASGVGAAALIAIIASLIVIYVLVLPPSDREAILSGDAEKVGEGPRYSSTGSQASTASVPTGGEDLLLETPGRLSFMEEQEVEHILPSVHLYTKTSAALLKKVNNIYVKNGWFDKKDEDISFSIEDLDNTDNVQLGFSSLDGQGRLMISLNGYTIYNRELRQSIIEPITLPRDYLKEENTIQLSVSEVGLKFWKTNEYTLSNIKITADLTDKTSQEAKQTFVVTATEKSNAQRVFVRFFPACKSLEVGRLDIKLNGHTIFSAVPDCGFLRPIAIDTHFLFSGENELTFKTTKGIYLIDQITVKSELREPTYPVYYFDIDEDYFKYVRISEEKECGDIDGFCPEDCQPDQDKDCCFEDSANNYWCDLETENSRDRCLNIVEKSTCNRCVSGYEDDDGDAPDACVPDDPDKGNAYCGDDDDDVCPYGCSIYYDKDCCFDEDDDIDKFWCDDMPLTGTESICEEALSAGECDDCVTGYDSEGTSPGCRSDIKSVDTEARLLEDFDVELKVQFTNDFDRKRARLYINGRLTHIDTTDREYTRLIDNFVQDGTNSVEIIPDTDLNIANVKAVLKRS